MTKPSTTTERRVLDGERSVLCPLRYVCLSIVHHHHHHRRGRRLHIENNATTLQVLQAGDVPVRRSGTYAYAYAYA